MESGAKGCEIIVSGKLRGQRAKAMKFIDGLMIHSGDPMNHFVRKAVKHVELRQGVLGIKVKIMVHQDPLGNIFFSFFVHQNSPSSPRVYLNYWDKICQIIS
jgi:small subunit ribosomal protein S3e